MFTLRCTQKLLDRGLKAEAGELPPPSNLLGDWYANFVTCGGQHLVLCASERTLLPAIVPVEDLRSLPLRLAAAAGEVMMRLGIDAAAVAAERQEMAQVRIGRTANRRVLGSLNDFKNMLDSTCRKHPEWNLVDRALLLARSPSGPIDFESPDRYTVAWFQSAELLSRLRQPAS